MIDNDDCGVGSESDCNRIKGPVFWRGEGKGCEWVPGKKKRDGECRAANYEAFTQKRDSLMSVNDQQEEDNEIQTQEVSKKDSMMKEYQGRKDKIDLCMKSCKEKCGFSITY